MRNRSRLFATVMLSAVWSSAAFAAPCLSPTVSCTEWVRIPAAAGTLMVYRSHPLSTRDANIEHAIILVHGAERDAATSFRIALAAAVLTARIGNTIVVAPRFAARASRGCDDSLAPDEINWKCDVVLGDWRMGGTSLGASSVSSFQVMDELLQVVEAKDVFPSLKTVVVAGHSAGGQFVTNYQMTNQQHEQLRIAPTYAAANASAYAYPDAQRPFPVNDSTCPSYAAWPFGIQGRMGYVGQASAEQLLRQAIDRRITYLVGDMDTAPAGDGFFGSCAALAQGNTRLERGVAFGRYMTERHNASQMSVVVAGCAHSERCMLLSPDGVRALGLVTP
jgi:pimeloyl-ACP methyl ester carboxylesterase